MKKVKIKITNHLGHTTLMESPICALEIIKNETQEKGMWAYVDGVFRNFDSLSEMDMQRANEIVITNSLLGG